MSDIALWEGSPENGPFHVEGIRKQPNSHAVVNKVPEIVNSFITKELADNYCNFLNSDRTEADKERFNK